jgi:hypothetical protein
MPGVAIGIQLSAQPEGFAPLPTELVADFAQQRAAEAARARVAEQSRADTVVLPPPHDTLVLSASEEAPYSGPRFDRDTPVVVVKAGVATERVVMGQDPTTGVVTVGRMEGDKLSIRRIPGAELAAMQPAPEPRSRGQRLRDRLFGRD